LKFLLASAGVTNSSIRNALLDLLGKPIADCTALGISTSSYALSHGPYLAWSFIAGQEPETPMTELGWRAVGNLELSALPSLGEAHWLPWIQEADALLVNGGDPLYLAYWMRQSGLATRLGSFDGVYVGLSAGSMIMTPDIGEEFAEWRSPTGGDDPLGLVDFSIFPHLANPDLPWNTVANAEKWAAKLSNPAYAIDDRTAIRVVDGAVDVISEGTWRHFAH
jgi:dipeptidase E